MAITYDAPSNTITVTGYTEGVPCAFLDVYNADVAGGWGVVSKQGNVQFLFDCKLRIGDGSTETWFADNQKQIAMADGVVTVHEEYWLVPTGNAHFTMGLVDDASDRTSSGGVAFHNGDTTHRRVNFLSTSSAVDVNLYSCYFDSEFSYNRNSRIIGVGGNIWNCILSYGFVLSDFSGDCYNITIENSVAGLRRPYEVTFNKAVITYTNYAIIPRGNTPCTFKNVVVRNSTYSAFAMDIRTVPVYGVNIDCDLWNFNWWGVNTEPFYRQYTFNRKILDKNGDAYASRGWKLYRDDGTVEASGMTQSDGMLSASDITVTHGYYDQAHGDTEQTHGPFKLEVAASGDNGKLTLLNLPIDEKDVTSVETMPSLLETVTKHVYSGPRRRRLPPLMPIVKKMTTMELYELYLLFKSFMVIDEQIWC